MLSDEQALEHFRNTIKDLFPGFLGVSLKRVQLDLVEAELEVRSELCNRSGGLHGGAIMGLADALGGVASWRNLDEGERTATIESKTNFLAQAQAGTTVTGRCTPLHKGRSTLVFETRISNSDGRLLAVVTQTQLRIPQLLITEGQG